MAKKEKERRNSSIKKFRLVFQVFLLVFRDPPRPRPTEGDRVTHTVGEEESHKLSEGEQLPMKNWESEWLQAS